jgi:hypothetical protein
MEFRRNIYALHAKRFHKSLRPLLLWKLKF